MYQCVEEIEHARLPEFSLEGVFVTLASLWWLG